MEYLLVEPGEPVMDLKRVPRDVWDTHKQFLRGLEAKRELEAAKL